MRNPFSTEDFSVEENFIRYLLQIRRYEVKKKQVQKMFLPPKSDVAFKELMRNESVRRYFLSDVLGIPLGEIREVRLENTFLSKRSRQEKQGILDVRMLLNNNCRINIELQIRKVLAWDKRSLYYLSKMYSEQAHTGEDYNLLKKCIVISILGFSWNDSSSYHEVNRMGNDKGLPYSDQLEVHVIELDKALTGDRLDDWIRLFRVENMEELKMLHSTNPGVMEAVKEVMAMNMGKRLRALYEEHKRIKMDRLYLRNNAIREGREEGRQKGRQEGRREGDLSRSRQVIYDFLGKLGTIPEDIRIRIEAEEDGTVLREWYMRVPQLKSFDEFRKYL